MTKIGLVALDTDAKWIGGRYYLHHLVRCVRSRAEFDSFRFSDVWWGREGPATAFADVRSMLDGTVVLRPPTSIVGRTRRYVKRKLTGAHGVGDLLGASGISAVFPSLPCANPGVPFIFWLPDFQYLHLPELFSEEMRTFYARYYEENVERASAVVVSSQHAAEDFQRVFPKQISKVRIVRFCSVPTEEWELSSPQETADRYGLPATYFVLPNQFSHHKNHGVIVEAVRILADRHLDAVVACTGSTFGFRGPDYFRALMERIESLGLRDRFKVLGLLPRSDYIALARGAAAVLQPSRFEGWSTVIEDARSLGKHILASDISVHREQLAGTIGARLLPLDDGEAWAAEMATALEARSCGGVETGDTLEEALEERIARCASSFVDAVALACAGRH